MAGGETKQPTKNMKPNPLLFATLVGIQFVLPAFAVDSTATNSTEAAQSGIPALTVAGTTTSSVETEEIEALKKEVRELGQKVRALEQQREVDQQTAAGTAKEQTRELDQKVRILARQRELDQESAVAAAKAQPRITVGANGVNFISADSNFVVAIHGLVQVDSRTFQKNNHIPGNDSILLRRARPIISGTVFHDFDFTLVPEFGNGTPGAASAATTPSIYDAYVNYRYSPAFQVQAGKFKSPVGLEYLQSDTYTFFNERSIVTDLVPGRDLGFELHGDIAGGVVSYAAGIFNGVGDARNTSNTGYQDNREFAGRLFVQPFKATSIAALQNFGAGVGGSWGDSSITNTLGLPNTTGGSAPGFFTEGQQQFFAYANGVVASRTHWRLSPQGSYYYGPLSLFGEYVISDQEVRNDSYSADLRNTAWEISGGWILTGEDATSTGVTPKHPFNPHNGQWGALQVVGRYAELDVDKDAFPFFSNPAVSASSAKAWAVGLNWYLNRNIRVNASYSRTTFTGGGGAGTSVPAVVTQHPEEVFFTRVQLAF